MFTKLEDIRLVIKPANIQFIADNVIGFIFLSIFILAIGYDNFIVKLLGLSLSMITSIILCYKLLLMKSIKWIITEEQIIYIRGVINKQINYIELYRVYDYKENQNFIEQIISTKRITIFSGDKSHPELNIFGINQKSNVVKIIRERVEINKQVKHIYEISNK